MLLSQISELNLHAVAHYENRTSEEGRFTPARCPSDWSGNSGGKPPFLTCSVLETYENPNYPSRGLFVISVDAVEGFAGSKWVDYIPIDKFEDSHPNY